MGNNQIKICLFAILLLSQSALQAASITVQGTTGSNGVDGVNGDSSTGNPSTVGTDGGSGEDAAAILRIEQTSLDADNRAFAQGGNGGNGGNGGSGLSAEGTNNNANGSNGGTGGTGGNATASVSVEQNSAETLSASSIARAAGGGTGGAGGRKSGALGTPGTDGRGGASGNAAANASVINTGSGDVFINVDSRGGTAGTINAVNHRLANPDPFAFNPADDDPRAGSFGSAGGASIQAYGESQGGTVNISGVAAGGRGAILSGVPGAILSGVPVNGDVHYGQPTRAGTAASVRLDNAVDGNTSGPLLLRQNAIGGIGGDNTSFGGSGLGGAGGNAFSSLSKTTDSQTLTVESTANGGLGGNRGFTNGSFIRVITSFDLGGNGGFAEAHSVADNTGGDATALATATGGNGGIADSGGVLLDPPVSRFGNGGSGGGALATARATSVGGRAAATAIQIGGSGGSHSIDSDNVTIHGAGADSIMLDAVSGSSDVLLVLKQDSRAGSSASRGADASSILTASNPGGGDIIATVSALGGFSQNRIGGNENSNGGNAFVSANLSGSRDVTLTGRALAARNNGTSNRKGGIGEIGQVIGASTGGGNVTVTGTVQMGNTDNISLINKVDGFTTGRLLLSQNAAASAFGGDSLSSLSKSVDSTETLIINTSASGGTATALSTAINNNGNATANSEIGAGFGGDGSASSIATSNNGDAVANSSTRGSPPTSANTISNATATNGGNAIANSQASAAIAANVISDATVINGGILQRAESRSDVFGNLTDTVILAQSTTTVQGATAINLATSNASASSANQFDVNGGGNANARATVIMNGASANNISARATAVGGNSQLAQGGSANAFAESIRGINTSVIAEATPGHGLSGAGDGAASAIARISEGSGTAQAIIAPPVFLGGSIGLDSQGITLRNSRGISGSSGGLPVTNLQATVNNQATTPTVSGGIEARLSLGTLSDSSTQADLFSDATVDTTNQLNLIAQAEVLPDVTSVNAALAGNTGVSNNFDVGGNSDMLALMTFGAMQDGTRDSLFGADISMSLDMTQLSTQQDLIFGFMNPVFTGNGFDSMTFQVFQENLLVIDETFTDIFSAELFFNDQTLNLGNWAQDLSGDLDLAFLIDFTISEAGDGFYFDTTYGNSTIGSGVVPVPAAVWLFGSGLIGLVGIARRKKSSRYNS